MLKGEKVLKSKCGWLLSHIIKQKALVVLLLALFLAGACLAGDDATKALALGALTGSYCGHHPVVGPNVLVNSRTTCDEKENGRTQLEPVIAVTGKAVIVEYNDLRGVYCPDQGYGIRDWAYSLDGGQTFEDQGAFPGGSSGDPWLATGSYEGIFYSVGPSKYPLDFPTTVSIVRGTVQGDSIALSEESLYIDIQDEIYVPIDRTAVTADPKSGFIYVVFSRNAGNPEGSSLELLRLRCDSPSPKEPCLFEDDSPIAYPDTPSRSTITDEPSMSSCQPLVGPLGEVYVIYKEGDTPDNPHPHWIWFQKSIDHGRTFSERKLIAEPNNYSMPGASGGNPARPTTVPSFAIDRSGGSTDGYLYVVWVSAVEPRSSFSDILLSRSTDGGETWSPPIKVNDNLEPAAHGFPTVAVNAAGFVDVFFFDRRDFPTDSQWTHLYLARSLDRGMHFETNVPVTDTPSLWNEETAGDRPMGRFGDYIGSTSQGCDTFVTWFDARNGDPDIYTARISSR